MALNQVCRTCLAADGLVRMDTIFCEDTKKPMSEMLKEYHHTENINLDPDHLICESCVIALPHAYKFNKLLEKADGYFRDIAKMHSTEYSNKTELDPLYTVFIKLEDELQNFDDEFTSTHTLDDLGEIKPGPREQEQPEKVSSTGEYDIEPSQSLTSKLTTSSTTDKSNGELKIGVTNECGIKPRVPCEKCRKTFKNKRSLRLHFRDFHEATSNQKLNQCCYCGKCFKHRTKLNIHEKIHLNIRDHVQIQHKERPHKCDICDKAFPLPSHLASHKRAHTNSNSSHPTRKRSYKCAHCEKCFSSPSSRNRHLRVLTGARPHKCPHCEKCFSRSRSLKTHIYSHTGERPFKCPQCEKCLSNSNSLKTHIYSHTGERPYKCPHCEKCFSTSGYLKSHINTHTGERPYKCSLCEMCFACPSTRHKHEKRRHTHTGEKPYKCPHCVKCFTNSGSLKWHTNSHTGERPYKCSHCEKCFAEPSTRNRHLNTHNGKTLKRVRNAAKQ